MQIGNQRQKSDVRSQPSEVRIESQCENGETETWLDFAHDGGYLTKGHHAIFIEKCHEVGAMLGSMINDPSSFILRPMSDLRSPISDL